MSRQSVDDVRNVLTQSNSAWNLREALKRALEIIDDRDTEIDVLNDTINDLYVELQFAQQE